MKRLSIYTIILSMAFLLGSCEKITEDLNVSPNSATNAPTDLILNGAQVSSILFYEGSIARLTGMWNRSFTGVDRQYVSLNNYVTTSGDYDDTWETMYVYVIAQLKVIEQRSLESNNKTMAGISQVMMAQAFGTAASLWGDVPFTEACDPAIAKPKFDTQTSVYAGVQTMLDNAITNLQANVGVGPGTKDIFFAGDRAKWIATAYTLKARFYLHTRNYAAALTASNNGISSAADNMLAKHSTANGQDRNIYYDFLVRQRLGYMTATTAYLPTLLQSTNAKYRGDAKTVETSRFKYLYTTTDTYSPNTAATAFFGTSSSFPLVTFEENKLIAAEANLKIGTPDETAALAALNAVRAYHNTGGRITASILVAGEYKYDPYVLTDFDPAGIQNAGSLTRQQAMLHEIIEEKYITLIGQIEQFNDVRRTGNLLGITPTTGTALPKRLLYPQSEINSNPNTPTTTLFAATTVNSTAY